MDFKDLKQSERLILFFSFTILIILFSLLFLNAKNRDDKYNSYKSKEYKKVITKSGEYIIIDNKAYKNGGQ